VVAACVLPDISLAGKKCPCALDHFCDPETNTCVFAAPGGHSGGGGDAGGGGEGGGGGPELPLANPLVHAGANELQSLHVDNLFLVEITEDEEFLIETYFDLKSEPNTDLLADNAPLTDVMQVKVPSELEYWGAGEIENVTITPVDRLPVSFGYRLRGEYPDPSLVAILDYTVFASGKIAVHQAIENQSADVVEIEDSEYNFTRVSDVFDPGWSFPSLAPDHFWWWKRAIGEQPRPTLLSVNRSDEIPSKLNDDHNCYWQSGGVSLASGSTLTRFGTIHLSLHDVGDEELAAIADDDRSARVETVVGGMVPDDDDDDGFDEVSGYFTAISAGGPLTVLLTPGTARRVAPAFEIQSWQTSDFRIRLGDQVLITSDMSDPAGGPGLVGYGMLARHVAADQRLYFIYLGNIEDTLSPADRTFTIEENL